MIGDEARAQVLERTGRLPQRVIACVGGGSNSIGVFTPFVGRRRGRADRRRGGRGGDRHAGRHGAPLTAAGLPGVLHGAFSALMQDEDGQILEAHSISAGLDYPGSGPEHAWLRDSGRARYVAVTDGEALEAFARTARASRASSRRSSPPTRSPGRSRTGRASSTSSACPDAATRIWPRRSSRSAWRGRPLVSGIERIAEAFASARADGRRAALMPYMMGGFPDLETLPGDRAGLRRGRRRSRRAGRSVLRPARRRARDPCRGDHRAARRGERSRTCSTSAASWPSASRSWSCATSNLIFARGVRALRRRARRAPAPAG